MSFLTALMKKHFLQSLEGLQDGRLHLTTPDGEKYNFGSTGTEVDLKINDWSVLPAMAQKGDVGLGETWIAGKWHTSSLEDLLVLGIRNMEALARWAYPGKLAQLRMRVIDTVLRANSLRGASRNIKAHYDVGNEFYQLWLDPGMTYSSALFAPGDNDLERAQARKNDRILSRLAGGERILEVGCGWGGFAERAAESGRHVTGLTLSPSQKAYADARLDGRADIRLQDYRVTQGRFDNIVSVEMIEAVGERYWPVYFRTIKDRLADGGKAVIQAITISDEEFPEYRKRSDFIRQHVFPGGMLLCDSAMDEQARNAGLKLENRFSFGLDYARTCRIWAERMLAETRRIRGLGYSDSFLRSWQFYLESCAATFATGRTDVVQVELAHAR